MNQSTNVVQAPESDRLANLPLVKAMSKDSQLDANAFISTVMRTCFSTQVTKEQFLAFLMVAKEYDLNPLTKEIYGFPKDGKVVPIVGIDGWLNMINKHPQLDGIEYEDHRNEQGVVEAITCIMYRKDRTHPVKVTEYLVECNMPKSQVWQKWPTRMLRHKATIQCARVAFGFSGIYDPDEGARIQQGESDIVGHAEIIPEGEPQDAAGSIVAKIGAKVEEMDFAPSEDAQEAAGEHITPDGEVITDGDIAATKLPPEQDAPAIEDIPGVTKASEIKAPKKKAAAKKKPQDQSNEDYVKDLE